MPGCPAGTWFASRWERESPDAKVDSHVNLSRNHLSDLERGKREIGLLMLQVIAKGLDTTMDKLLKGL